MTNTNELGAIRDDLISLFAITMGKEKATAKVNELEAMIRGEAKKGAEQAIPTIKAEVKKTAEQFIPAIKTEVKKTIAPWAIAAIVLGALGLAAGIGAVIYVRKRKS